MKNNNKMNEQQQPISQKPSKGSPKQVPSLGVLLSQLPIARDTEGPAFEI